LSGVTRAGRNGHHDVDGFADTAATEARRLCRRIPIFIVTTETIFGWRSNTSVSGSLTSPGFASGVHPEQSALSPLHRPKAKALQEQSI
jgi:hypothetical protein